MRNSTGAQTSAGMAYLCSHQRPTSQVLWKHEHDGRIPATARTGHWAAGNGPAWRFSLDSGSRAHAFRARDA
jgi:hypothetical protein